MEPFALYLLKSVIWLTGFALVFILFLRNERFFFLNRLYLIAGILTSFLFPFISVRYTVELPLVNNIQTVNTIENGLQTVNNSSIPDTGLVLFILYLSGVLFVTFMIIKQSRPVMKSIKKAEILTSHPVKLIRTAEYVSSFSFFSYVFVNPSITDVETKEIVNHEMVHIRQWHWFDLVLVELLRMLQWFNPVVWIYVRFMRQNHEYLADEVALQRTSDPAIYKAALLNQLVGSPVVSLATSFNYSLNKKRFNMMKNIINSPYRKMKIFLILPVFAIVLYAFAKPEYKYTNADENSGNLYPVSTNLIKEVKGTIVRHDGKPLQGATVVITGTSIGVTADAKGYFSLDKVPDEASLVVSYVGFKTKVLKPVFTSEMTIKMERDTVKYLNANITPPPSPPPPPPPSAGINVRSASGKVALYVVDGNISSASEVHAIGQDSIESISVIKDNSAAALYGDKGKDGVILITTKKPAAESANRVQIRNTDGRVINPLYVIDGVVKDKLDLDPMMISHISVLKDKSATDKYGEKGMDGVIEITTKSGMAAESSISAPTPPPPPPPAIDQNDKYIVTPPQPLKGIKIRGDGPPPLIVLDGNIKTEEDLTKVDPDAILYVNVLKGESAVLKYGDIAKDGVIEITSKSTVTQESGNNLSDIKVTGYGNKQKTDEKMFVVVEEMPQFPGGGNNAMRAWISANLKYPAEAVKAGVSGTVYIDFLVTRKGKVKNVSVSKPLFPALDAEAIRCISKMPDWKPGTQAGKGVDVQIKVPVEFKLN